jgi:hypothetical protein
MEVYRHEAEEILRRFLDDQLSFAQCVAALEDALDGLDPKPTGQQLVSLQILIAANNEIIAKEMKRRRSPEGDSVTGR